MRGQRGPFRGRAGGRDQSRDNQQQPFPSPSQPPQLTLDPNFALQNLNYLQNIAYASLHGFSPQQNFTGHFPYHQNPNFPIQNPNIPFPHQFPNNLAQQHGYTSQRQPPHIVTQQQFQNLHPQKGQKVVEQKGKELLEGAEKEALLVSPQQVQNVPLQVPEKDEQKEKLLLEGVVLRSHNSEKQQAQYSPLQNMKQVKYQRQYRKQFVHEGQELIGRVDKAVEKAWGDLLASGESVSTWKASQAALMTLQVDSWDSLGFRMQEVPSLHRLILIEGKINAFIHCFVGVRRITSLYDLEMAICENEGIERFEELGLGPLLRHPLVVHYFLVSPDVTEVLKITTEDIILSLHEYMTTCSKKDVIIDEFLDFIAKNRSAKGKGNLGIRIQSLGMHISFIREASRSEHVSLKKSGAEILRASAKGSGNKSQKRPVFSSQKKNLDKRFSAISQRLESFAYTHKDFRGKHIRFDSSGSEDEESDDSSDEDNMNSNDDRSHLQLQNVHNTDRVSTCPYPSATEEISRLGLKGEIESQSPPVGSSSTRKRAELRTKKRKLEDASCTYSAPAKLLKGKAGRQIMRAIQRGDNDFVNNMSETDLSLSYDSIKRFITTWKETFKEHTLTEVLDRMADFCRIGDGWRGDRDRRRLKTRTKLLFSLDPWIGLLNVAVTAIKSDMFDSIYNAFDSIIQNELPSTRSEYESIDVEPSEKQTSFVSHGGLQQIHSVTAEEILQKISEYYKLDPKFWSNGKSPLEDKFSSLKKLCSCEFWLLDQYRIKEFKSLDHGEFFSFLEKHAYLLPTEIQKLFAVDICGKPPLEVSVLQNQLMLLVSQAATNLWEDETIAKQMIFALFAKQFPLLSFRIVENGSMEDFLKVLGEYKKNAISNCVLFSATLLGKEYAGEPLNKDQIIKTTEAGTNGGQKMSAFESITSKSAIEVLLRAPMLSDLNSWSHWDLIFAPSLGPLVGWLLSEVNAKELLCLVTKDGKVIRINQSANADSFLEAALQKSAFQTAVELLSLVSLAGGEKHVPLLLLKSYACRAFDVILKIHYENIEVHDNKNYISHGKIVNGVDKNVVGSVKFSTRTNQGVLAASRYLIDCLGYLPSEFHGFVADILVHGMQSVFKDAPYAILCECNQKERIMLHQIGLSIGIAEWIDDYHKFCSSGITELFTPSIPVRLGAVRPALGTGSSYMQNTMDMYSCGDGVTTICLEEVVHNNGSTETSETNQDTALSIDGIDNGCAAESSESNKKDATQVIESIRRYEFGLDPNLSCSESTMLEKQHARLGRALHCLSQELYSEDSHFLLELVQNADDNIYPGNVEPTLTFILQESSIVVLNNEQGFSEQNIRALCDVGNSTKKGSGTGYIGQKGIGFKSVFRVTDAPEIHSNGFHIKFDISGGQIGFVLPTVVAPCNIELYSKLILRETCQMNRNTWNTCILLPFRSKLSEETAMKMFSDLHPSLLLFLHRLQCIMFRNVLNNSLLVMRKEILQDGIIKVSCGKYKMTWLVESQKLQAHTSRPKVQTTEIAIAFPLEESNNGDYCARLELQPVFAFLPLRTYGLKFILQGDFVLPSSRQEVDKNDPWNEWLLTKFPGLFVKAERSFCALSCLRDNPGKAVSAFMNFVPLVGEVHGFFSGLPKAIALELRRTSCLLLEGDKCKMVPPCNVLRGWNEQALELLPDGLLQEHLGLGLLDRNIVLSDSLARALGIAGYGPEILIKFITCLCRVRGGLESMGLGWLSSFLNALYMMLSQCSEATDLIDSLKQIPFIPLSDGTYSAVDGGTIWLHSDSLNAGFDGTQELEAFPQLYAKLRIVNPAVFSTSAADRTIVDNIVRMLQKIGAQQLSAHEIMKVHILPAISNDGISTRGKDLITDYLCFVMIHLQSSCPNCCFEREHIISELQSKAYILTNFGYRRLVDTSIHFSKEFDNHIDINKLINNFDMKWHEVDISYLKHPVNDSLSDCLMKWRRFLLEIGVTDFVQVVQAEKNFSDLYHTVLKNTTWDAELISAGVAVKDWESHELVQILSLLCIAGDRKRCKYLLEVLDTLWDDIFSSKATGYCNSISSVDGRTFMSSFLSSIRDVRWVASSMDNKLHYPKDLFHDCDTVRSLLGGCAPYALPKVRSTKLVSDIGFKTKVTLDDALEILRAWREADKPFKASIAQMSKLYSFIWGEIVASKKQVSEALHSVPFIFVPHESVLRHEDVVSGVFLSSEEVYWHDPTGCVNLMKKIHPQNSFTSVPQQPLMKTLCDVYTGLYDFFVKECGVCEVPSCHGYFDILKQLSTVALPSQAARKVFQVFLKWADELRSGSLSSKEIINMKECLMKEEYAVLPTVLDKWVSLHPSFHKICWCDDKNLKKMFKETDDIDFLYFGNLSVHEEDVLRSKVSDLLQNLGIPALSEIITREPIYYGPADCSLKASLIDWALPYAQRYIYCVHRDLYLQLKQSEFNSIKQLKITVVEKLFYRNALKSSGTASKKRHECSCLLQGNTLYATSGSDSHALFLELSCLFFGGTSNLHLANFLHMITTMVESGSTEDQIESFIMNSQKMPKVPDDESSWSLSTISSSVENDESFRTGVELTAIHNQISKSKKKVGISSSWPPADWKTAPGFEHGSRSQVALQHRNSSSKDEENDLEEIDTQNDTSVPFEINADWMIEDSTTESDLLDSENLVNKFAPGSNQTVNTDVGAAPIRLPSESYDAEPLPIISNPEPSSSRFSWREKLQTGTPNAAEILRTGRLGEQIAFKYLTQKFRGKVVRWVNEDNETGLPYDIVLEKGEESMEYFEVKATKSARKDWFNITKREWQFAAEKQESFSIAHVILSINNTARVTIFRNPVKQCQTGKLQLVLMMPREREGTVVSDRC
ncbi:protein NO VEIN [Euphorbia lathyris]|uniref:protein NO VEIN n=1 Tax=Euphorbia lathyris TaxID=212925 RepID=UPI003313286B